MEITEETQAPIKGLDIFHPGFSVDCVILGFSEGELKVLMMQYKGFDFWKLPGSFVFKDEDVDAAALRILYERTGLDKIFLQQFFVFGKNDRLQGWGNDNLDFVKWRTPILQKLYGWTDDIVPWFEKRFISAGYYALVDCTKFKPTMKILEADVQWRSLDSFDPYYADHRLIIDKALETIRLQLEILPLGRELLPDKFTMSELRVLYEAILGKKLDRRNFQRKVFSFGYIEKLNEKRKGGAHKNPTLFRFNDEKYNEALVKGVGMEW